MPVTALVVVSRGGAALEATVASLGWVARRRVVDPAARLGSTVLPAGAQPWDAHEPCDWVLLVAEGELVRAPRQGAVEALERSNATAYRVVVECHAFGGAIRLRRAPIRLARGVPPAARVSLGGELTFAVAGDVDLLGDAVIARPLPPLPADAVDSLNAEATVLAVLARAEGTRPHLVRLAASGVVGAARVLFGRSRGRLGWGRWIAAVVAGYRALLVEAKLWERAQLEVPPP